VFFRLDSAFHPIADAGAVASAHGNLLAVAQDDAVVSVALGTDLLEVLEIDDRRAVDAKEGSS